MARASGASASITAPGPVPPGLRSEATREGGTSEGPGARASGASASITAPPIAEPAVPSRPAAGAAATGAAGLPPFARVPVLAIAAGVGAVLLLTSGRYGYFGDELYFLAAGRRLSWGYADQPPLLPLLARAVDVAFGGSLVALRLLPMVLAVLGVLVTAQIARELGGGRRAQVLAAAAVPTSSFLLSTGHLLYTATVDVLLWAVVTWLLVRWTRTRDDKLLLWLGGAVAVALQAKYLIVFFCVVAAGCVLAAGPRELLRRPLLWAGAAIAVLSALPGLVWQASHDWPQWKVGAVISAEGGANGRLLFLPTALLAAGLVIGAVLVLYGQWRLLRSPDLRPYRFLGWTALALTAAFIAAGGRPFYVAGLFPLLWAVAAVELQRQRLAGWRRWVPSWPVYCLSVLFALTALPVLPVSWHAQSPDMVTRGSLGWPELADTVAAVHRSLPPAQAAGAVVVADSYWRASALDWFGPGRGVPRVYSGDRGFADFGVPPDDSGVVLFVGDDPGELRGYFDSTQRVATSTSPGVTHAVWICTGRRAPWSAIWPRYRNL